MPYRLGPRLPPTGKRRKDKHHFSNTMPFDLGRRPSTGALGVVSVPLIKEREEAGIWGMFCACLGFVFRPLMSLLKVKLPVYAIFLLMIALMIISQGAIMYRNHSIFLRINDVMDAINPMHSDMASIDNAVFSTSTDLEIDNAQVSTGTEITDDVVQAEDRNPFAVGAEETVVVSNMTYDYRECTSPESHVPWPMGGEVHSKTSDTITCGLQSDSLFASFFRHNLWKRKYEPLIKKCNKLVVFGVAFGGKFVEDLDAPHVRSLVNATELQLRHGRCFFILTTEDDLEKNSKIIDKYNKKNRGFADVVTIGHNILIPLPNTILPYKNPRRNVKLLKYMGQYMFEEAETVIWQDAKFFRDDFVSKQPRDYSDMVEQDTCVSTMGLPIHKITVGLDNIRTAMKKYGRYRAQYEHHCQTIIAALIDRPNVTDSSENLIRQCDAYLQNVLKEEGNTDTMNHGLIDSAFIVWNHKSKTCREFSNTLRCTIMDQIQCHSDRDQVSIPFAMYKMGLSAKYRQRRGENLQKVDEGWDPRIHDLDFVANDSLKQNSTAEGKGIAVSQQRDESVMIRVTRSSCHWYFSRLGNCRTDLMDKKPTVALLVAGSAKRFVFQGVTEHFIKPLVSEQNTMVDYYLMLSVKQGLAYRSTDDYMKYQTFDPTFAEISRERDTGVVTAHLFNKVRNMISASGANVGGVHIQPQPMKLDAPLLRKMQLDAKRARPKEDSYYRFPTLDLRPEYRRRTAVINRNIFKLYLGLQKLWDKHLKASEAYVGVSYDYIMVVREDVMWLEDFNLQKLIDTNPSADAYILSCDLRDPPIIQNEYNDYAIVIKREKAAIIGRYFDQILKTDLDGCHASVRDMVPADTGCNSGMLFHWIMKSNNVTVQKVPQSIFPIERTLNVMLNGTRHLCIHRKCQSSELPLKIPKDMQLCGVLTA